MLKRLLGHEFSEKRGCESLFDEMKGWVLEQNRHVRYKYRCSHAPVSESRPSDYRFQGHALE